MFYFTRSAITDGGPNIIIYNIRLLTIYHYYLYFSAFGFQKSVKVSSGFKPTKRYIMRVGRTHVADESVFTIFMSKRDAIILLLLYYTLLTLPILLLFVSLTVCTFFYDHIYRTTRVAVCKLRNSDTCLSKQ